MIFRQILHPDLGCASYLLGDGGEAVVVDPRWDVDVYLDTASAEGLQITHVIDTHNHADHVSGRERLAASAEAVALAPADPSQARSSSSVLAAGCEIRAGRLGLTTLATPGHRPEHLSLVVSDLSRGPDPWLVLTGDSLLVGDLARPDLAMDPRLGAIELRRSLDVLLALGDDVELWPGHVGGSLCGGARLSGKTSSTIGYERRHNPLLDAEGESFVERLLEALPSRPPNVARVVALNQLREPRGPREPALLDVAGLAEALAAGAQVIDGRPPQVFDDGHLHGAINLQPGGSQGTRAGWVLDPGSSIVVVGTDRADASAIAARLHAVGLWEVVGVVAADPGAWAIHGLDVRVADSWNLTALVRRMRNETVKLIDVREPREWVTGHVGGSMSLPLHSLAAPPAALSGYEPRAHVAVACAAGARAAFAASVIRRWTELDVVRVSGGGIGDLLEQGIVLTRGE